MLYAHSHTARPWNPRPCWSVGAGIASQRETVMSRFILVAGAWALALAQIASAQPNTIVAPELEPVQHVDAPNEETP